MYESDIVVFVEKWGAASARNEGRSYLRPGLALIMPNDERRTTQRPFTMISSDIDLRLSADTEPAIHIISKQTYYRL